MAITHHALVRLAAHISGKTEVFEDYLVLGDDIVIADKDVAKSYLSLIESIGVSISMGKSVVRNDTHFSLEFASQYLCNEDNLSPLPVGLLYERSTERMFAIWDALFKRGFCENSVDSELTFAYDFKDEFPLSGGREAYSDLSTMWALRMVFKELNAIPGSLESGIFPLLLGSKESQFAQWLRGFYPLALVHRYNELYKLVKAHSFQSRLSSLEEHAFDNSAIMARLFKSVPARALEVRKYLES